MGTNIIKLASLSLNQKIVRSTYLSLIVINWVDWIQNSTNISI
jgi:hypothetical protein